MNWSAFLAAITWGITVVSGILTIISVAVIMTGLEDSGLTDKGAWRALIFGVICFLVTLIGVATISGMGWAQ